MCSADKGHKPSVVLHQGPVGLGRARLDCNFAVKLNLMKQREASLSLFKAWRGMGWHVGWLRMRWDKAVLLLSWGSIFTEKQTMPGSPSSHKHSNRKPDPYETMHILTGRPREKDTIENLHGKMWSGLYIGSFKNPHPPTLPPFFHVETAWISSIRCFHACRTQYSMTKHFSWSGMIHLWRTRSLRKYTVDR